MTQILTGAASTIPGYSSLPPFDISKPLSIIHYLQAMGWEYGLGCKFVDIAASPPQGHDYMGRYGGGDVDRVDCSGLARYMVNQATGGIVAPDGSSAQNDYCAAQGFKHHSHDEYLTNMGAGYLYWCFCRAGSRGETIGHTWLAWKHSDGRFWTAESHGGSGPDVRPASTPILTEIVTDFYTVAKI